MQTRIFHTTPDNPVTENYIDPATGELYEAEPQYLCRDCTTPAIDVETTGAMALHLVHDAGCPSTYIWSAGTPAREAADR